jgi:hypothetical protein
MTEEEFIKNLEGLKVPEYFSNIREVLEFEKNWKTQLSIVQKSLYNIVEEYRCEIRRAKKSFQDEIVDYKTNIKCAIQNFINAYHNPELVNFDISPNENTIYKLYNDFSITSEKGGWAYGQRSQFLVYPPLRIGKDIGFNFPLENYAILELENCIKLREMYETYISLS